jgi:hypothetical protein
MHHQQRLLLFALDRHKRMLGRPTASQIASASLPSFFWLRDTAARTLAP